MGAVHQDQIKLPLELRKALTSAFYFVAISTTVLRLLYRTRAQQLWWDDIWAFFALLCSILSVILLWGNFWLVKHIDSTTPVPLASFLVIGTLVSYVAGLWCARISVAVTIVRIVGKGMFKRTAKTVTLLFAIGATVLILFRVFRCGVKFDKAPFCKTPLHVTYTELVLDVLADAWLVVAPLVLLSKIALSLSDEHRRLIAYIFGCSLFTTSASIAHIVFMALNEESMMGFTAHIQFAISTIVCNLLVLVTYIYRKFRRPEEEESTYHSTVQSSTSAPSSGSQSAESSLSDSKSGPQSRSSNENSLAPSSLAFTSLGSSRDGSDSSYSQKVQSPANSSVPGSE